MRAVSRAAKLEPIYTCALEALKLAASLEAELQQYKAQHASLDHPDVEGVAAKAQADIQNFCKEHTLQAEADEAESQRLRVAEAEAQAVELQRLQNKVTELEDQAEAQDAQRALLESLVAYLVTSAAQELAEVTKQHRRKAPQVAKQELKGVPKDENQGELVAELEAANVAFQLKIESLEEQLQHQSRKQAGLTLEIANQVVKPASQSLCCCVIGSRCCCLSHFRFQEHGHAEKLKATKFSAQEEVNNLEAKMQLMGEQILAAECNAVESRLHAEIVSKTEEVAVLQQHKQGAVAAIQELVEELDAAGVNSHA